jgi:hypothetical protein
MLKTHPMGVITEEATTTVKYGCSWLESMDINQQWFPLMAQHVEFKAGTTQILRIYVEGQVSALEVSCKEPADL